MPDPVHPEGAPNGDLLRGLKTQRSEAVQRDGVVLVHVRVGDVDSLVANLSKRSADDVGKDALAPKSTQRMHVAKLDFVRLRLPVGNRARVARPRQPENVRHLFVPESQVELSQTVRAVRLKIRRPGTRSGGCAQSGQLHKVPAFNSQRCERRWHEVLRQLPQIQLQPETIPRSAKIRAQQSPETAHPIEPHLCKR